MHFDFDEQKSDRNRAKHGIDFLEAQFRFADPNRVEVPAKTEDEPRSLVIGRIGSKHWSAVVTQRPHATRIISVRRSREEKIALYES